MIQRRGQTIEVGCLIRFKDKRKGKQGRIKSFVRRSIAGQNLKTAQRFSFMKS